MRLFVDTNIFLSFLEASKENTRSLVELKTLINDKKVKLVFPQITQEEYYRNIPRIVSTLCDEIDGHLPKKPEVAVSLRENKKITKDLAKAHKKYSVLLKNLKEQYSKSVERINVLYIEKLVNKSEKFSETKELLDLAQARCFKGNHPGKKNGVIGDEIEWEILLKYCFDDDLTIISNDKDWRSTNIDGKVVLNTFLTREWGMISDKKIILETSLGKFINSTLKIEKIPSETISREESESSKIGVFTVASSFATTSSINSSVFSPTFSPSTFGTIPYGNGGGITFGSMIQCPKCGNFFLDEQSGQYFYIKRICPLCKQGF